MIGIILPTRGLVFTEVEIAIEKMRENKVPQVKVFRSFNKTIPEGINDLVAEALKNEDISKLFFIEEDTVPPVDALTRLSFQVEDIAFIDYGVNGWSCSARDKTTNKILWCGLGCTMVKRQVFEKVPKPWFRSDKALCLNDLTWIDTNPQKVYGGQDIWFCRQAIERGCTIKQVAGECRHLKLENVGRAEINKGLHEIVEKPKIEKLQIIDFRKGACS